MADKNADDALALFGAATTEAEAIVAIDAIKELAERQGGGANVAGALSRESLTKMAHVKKPQLGALWTPKAAQALGAALFVLSLKCTAEYYDECANRPASQYCAECDEVRRVECKPSFHGLVPLPHARNYLNFRTHTHTLSPTPTLTPPTHTSLPHSL